MTDKNTLDLAHEWAEEIADSRQVTIRADALAAAEVISSLPDEWVDASELRYAISAWEFSNIAAAQFVDMVRDTLPTPPAPRTMDEIEWDDGEHHLAEATAAWTEGHPSNVVMLNKFGKKITVYQSAPHYSGLRELNPGILTPTGRKYRLEPEDDTPTSPIEDKPAPEPAAPRPEDVPEFDPAYTYRDRDGDEWPYVAGGWRWGGDVFSRPHSAPPAKYGPYRKDRLVPESAEEDGEPEFDPAYTYRDKDGDTWEFLNHNWRWLDTAGDINGNYDTPPAQCGPYTRIEKKQ